MTEDPGEAAIKRAFARRALAARIALGAGALAATLRLIAKVAWWPPALAWLGAFWLWVPLAVGAVLIWSYRCPGCGGGIRLDGKTCSSCKRVLA